MRRICIKNNKQIICAARSVVLSPGVRGNALGISSWRAAKRTMEFYAEGRVKDFLRHFINMKVKGEIKTMTPLRDFLEKEVTHPIKALHFFQAACFTMLALGKSRFGRVLMVNAELKEQHMLLPYVRSKAVGEHKLKQCDQNGYMDIHFVKDGTLYLTACDFNKEPDYEMIVDEYQLFDKKIHERDFAAINYVVFCRDKNAFKKDSPFKVDYVFDLDDVEKAFGRLLQYYHAFETYGEACIPFGFY